MSTVSIAIVKSAWHADIVDAFASSCAARLLEFPFNCQVAEYQVPGVVEIPLFCRKLIALDAHDILVVTGLIADHGVYRHDFVAATVMDATMKLQMDTGVPVIYGILTPQDFMSEGREAFFAEHFVKKGREAAEACRMTLDNDRLLSGFAATGT